MADFNMVPIPKATRKRKAGLMLAATILVPGSVLWYVYAEDQLGWATFALLPFFLIGLWASYRYWRTAELRLPTPEALAAEAQKQRNQAELEEMWYYRYPIAVILLVAAFYLLGERPQLWWMSAVLAICAAIQARELALIAVIAGGGYMVVGGIASLPTSAAIILGAIIISAAITGRNGN